MKTHKYPTPPVTPTPKLVYTAEQFMNGDCPEGVYIDSAASPSRGYWVTSHICRLHWNREENRINTVGRPFHTERLVRVDDAEVIFNILGTGK